VQHNHDQPRSNQKTEGGNTGNNTAMQPENSPANARKPPASIWKPGQSGNPAGKPRGAKHRATMLAEQMIGDEAERVVRKVIDLALAGDITCLRLCLERLAPPRKDSPVTIRLPRIERAADAVSAMSMVIGAVGDGEVTPTEGAALAGIVETHRRVLETADLAARIEALEARDGPRTRSASLPA
jgi:hypothetical protein